ncbi:MarR family winged helix-turn-helix transcriptional regulator [Ciceribacter ferrooxidans]|uniref:MarR family transcriptional regulator n=1 Tax=Ciceribacter ferrooxidans TaxID=2509717 RepID=A0A4Q2SYW8_9HYPH|nr:MarR family transcriptional regulator [Ciceribacter ferrooxidans]RYC09804.1 MarR family transcriptional regulator [Ciceribacter ferrooxidans]
MARQIASERDLQDDHVGVRRRQWSKELPDVDTVGMAILGRARWITLKVRPPIEAVFAEHGLDTGEFDVLATLLRSGPPYRLRPTELFQQLMITSGGLTPRLARLEKAGLIERPPSESDGRSLPVQLTTLGRERAEAAFRADMTVETDLLRCLNDQEKEDLGRLLAKLAIALDT